jgi:drug/metabolite transporter (DMT)-like permease
MKNDIMKTQKVVLALAVTTTFLWGSAFPCIKIGYALFQIADADLFSKILFAGYRFALAGFLALLFGLPVNKRISLPQKNELKGILLLGLVQTTLQYAFFYIGLAYTTAVKSSILYSVNTFIAVILAHYFCQNERLDLRKGLGCLSGFAGVIVINLNGDKIGSGFSLMGEGMVLLAAASFGAGALISKKTAQEGDVISVTGYQLLSGGLVLILLGLAGKGHLSVFSIGGVGGGIYLALLSAVSFTIWTILLKFNEVGRIAVYNFLIPIFGVILSAAFLGESILEVRILGALLLVCAGIFIINMPSFKIKKIT